MNDIGAFDGLMSGVGSVGVFESLYQGRYLVGIQRFTGREIAYNTKGCIASSLYDLVFLIGDGNHIAQAIMMEKA
jgi:hypothetical protein